MFHFEHLSLFIKQFNKTLFVKSVTIEHTNNFAIRTVSISQAVYNFDCNTCFEGTVRYIFI